MPNENIKDSYQVVIEEFGVPKNLLETKKREITHFEDINKQMKIYYKIK